MIMIVTMEVTEERDIVTIECMGFTVSRGCIGLYHL